MAASNAEILLARPDRDLRIDFFRGLALIGITLNHTVPPKRLMEQAGHYAFGHAFGFTWAEVFVFLSGMVCGMAYLGTFEKRGLVATYGKSLKRIGVIWLTAMGALVLMWVVLGAMQKFLPAYQRRVVFLEFDYRNMFKWRAVKDALLLSPPYMHFNILRFYVVLLLMVPAGMWLYVRARPIAIAVSVLAWAGINVAWKLHRVSDSFGDGPFGNYFAWQLLFFMGLWVGIERKRGRFRLPFNASVAVLFGAVLVLADALRQLKFAYFHFDDKVHLGPLRIVELMAVVTLIAWTVPAQASFFSKGLAGVIRRLGTRSLTIFAFTLFSCYLFTHIAAFLNVGAAGYLGILIVHVIAVLSLSAGLDQWQLARTEPRSA